MRSFVDFQLCTCKYVRRYSRLETICKRMEKIYLQNVSRLSSLCSDMDSMIQTDSDARISWKFSTDLWSGLRSEPKADFELSTSDGRTRSTGHSQDIQSVQEKENIAFIASQNYADCITGILILLQIARVGQVGASNVSKSSTACSASGTVSISFERNRMDFFSKQSCNCNCCCNCCFAAANHVISECIGCILDFCEAVSQHCAFRVHPDIA